MQSSPLFRYLAHLTPKYGLQHTFPNTLTLCSSLTEIANTQKHQLIIPTNKSVGRSGKVSRHKSKKLRVQLKCDGTR